MESLHCEGISSGSQVVLILGHSAGAAAPSFFHACACGISICWLLEEVFCSVFLSSACGFLFTAFSRQLAASGVLLVVSSTGCCLNGSVLCSSFSQLFFLANVCGGPGVLPFGALASFHSPFAALLLLFKYLCLLLLVYLFVFLNACGFAFLSRTWPSGCGVLPGMSVRFEEFLFVIF